MELLTQLGDNPLVRFLVGMVGFGVFVRLVMLGLNYTVLSKMEKSPKRKWAKRLAAHGLGPALAIILFGNELFTMGPRRGWWGYIGAAAMGWAGSLAAVAWHTMKKKKAKAEG